MHGIATDSIIIEKTHIQTRPFTPFFKKLEKLEKIKDVSPFPGPDEGWELEAEDYPLFYGVDYMAAENPHQEIVSDLHGIWKGLLRKQGVELRMDVFLYYRDSEGKLKPTAPDLWAIPLGRTKTSSYNVEEEPPPLFAVEVTSKGSHVKDLETNVDLYLKDLKIPGYLVINQVTKKGELLVELELRLWKRIGNRVVEQKANDKGGFAIPELNTEIYPEGRNLKLVRMDTGEVLQSIDVLEMLLEQEAQRAEQADERAKQEAQRAEQEAQRAEQEAQRAEQAESIIYSTVQNMLAKGMNTSLIAEITGLSIEAIMNLTKK